MSADLPRFDKPPVSETVIGVQFSPLEGFSTAHAGRFWAELGEDWTKTQDAGRLMDQFERFGDDRAWAAPGIQVVPAADTNRVLIIRRDDERLIQVQGSRFVYNWRRRGGGYPTYRILFPEFREHFAAFEEFVAKSELGTLDLNQWEITYVNHLPKGDLWKTPDTWKDVMPGFYVPATEVESLSFDGFGGQWNLVIGESRGRLHITIQHAKIARPEEGPEILSLQFTARGPVDRKAGFDLWSGLELGHEAIVRSFAAMTSDAAHRSWGRTE